MKMSNVEKIVQIMTRDQTDSSIKVIYFSDEWKTFTKKFILNYRRIS